MYRKSPSATENQARSPHSGAPGPVTFAVLTVAPGATVTSIGALPATRLVMETEPGLVTVE
jgi:hypothetical protein